MSHTADHIEQNIEKQPSDQWSAATAARGAFSDEFADACKTGCCNEMAGCEDMPGCGDAEPDLSALLKSNPDIFNNPNVLDAVKKATATGDSR